MAINEKIVTGRKFRRLIDKEAKLWQRFSWWTSSNDVECGDGKTVEQKIGNINGITSDFAVDDSSICASSILTNRIKTDLNDGIINDHIQFVIDEDGNLGWKKDGADTVIPFSSVIGLCGKLKGFSRSSADGQDCVYYLSGNCIPISVWSIAHHPNGSNYSDEWNIFRKKAFGYNNIVSVTPIASYTTKQNKVDKITSAKKGDTIVGWRIIGKSLDKEDTPENGSFNCYYIDGQNNLKYDDLYKSVPTIESNKKPHPLV